MEKLAGLILLVILAAVPSFVQHDTIDGFVGRVHVKSRREQMPYRLYIPPSYDSTREYPLVLWLHGGGSAGNDNVGQISRDNRLGTHFWTRKEYQEKYAPFVLAPQSTAAWDSNTERNLSSELRMVLEILEVVRKEYRIDPDRIYVAGQSNGGIGAWGLITKAPGIFAAAIPLCGAGNVNLASRAAGTAIWAFHGETDDVISASYSRNMIAAIRKAGGTPRYTEFPNTGHDIWERVFNEPGLADWLFAQRRS